MSQFPSLPDNAFAVLSFLAAPAILTNASTLLALGTSNRLARASDRARAAATQIVSSTTADSALVAFQQKDFQFSTRRASMLITALRRFYLAAGCFAAGTGVALLGAFANHYGWQAVNLPSQIGTILVAFAGMGALVSGAFTLIRETRLALQSLDMQHAAITQWRATHQATGTPGPPPPRLTD